MLPMARGRVGGARTPSACDVLLTLALHAGNVILLTAAAALQENQGCGSGGGDQAAHSLIIGDYLLKRAGIDSCTSFGITIESQS